MNIQGNRCRTGSLLTLVCASVSLYPLSAADGTSESTTVIATEAAITAPLPKLPSGSLIGVTLAPGGFSLAAVTVDIRNVSGSDAQQLTSDADGSFAVKDLTPGTYEITASKEGFITAVPITVEVAANKTANANVQLIQGVTGSLRGVALAPDGFSVAGVNVVIHSVAGSLDRTLVTDANGIFLAKDLPPGSYQVSASKPGFTSPAGAIVGVVRNRTSNASVQLTESRPVPAPPVQTAQAVSPAQSALPPLPAATKPGASGPATPAVDLETPFAFGDFTWLNGTPRTKTPVFDSPFFTAEVRFDTHYVEDDNQPIDHTIVGSTELFRSGEIQIEQASVGGDFHWQNVRGRVLFMTGLFATTTPRNDASSATGSAPGNTGGVGQWDLQNAYR